MSPVLRRPGAGPILFAEGTRISQMSGRGKDAAFNFFLTDGCSLAPVTAAIECLRAANLLLAPGRRYSWRTLSETGTEVPSESGLRLAADGALSSLEPTGNFFLNLGPTVSDTLAQALSQRLHSAKYAYARVGALSVNSVEFLARKRVLAGRQVVVHWNREAPLREKYPDIQLTTGGYAIDGGLYSVAAGSSAAEHLFLKILSEDFGMDFATHVADMLYIDTTRSNSTSRRRSLSARLGRQNEAITRIVRLMEKHVEETLSLRDLAGMAGVSPRHAERLFRKALGKTPLQYYLGIRLEHARRLLVYSDLTLGEIALASGFKGSSIFNKKYTQYFGNRPAEERGVLKMAGPLRETSDDPKETETRLACR